MKGCHNCLFYITNGYCRKKGAPYGNYYKSRENLLKSGLNWHSIVGSTCEDHELLIKVFMFR